LADGPVPVLGARLSDEDVRAFVTGNGQNKLNPELSR
jgi:hypothetical protein